MIKKRFTLSYKNNQKVVETNTAAEAKWIYWNYLKLIDIEIKQGFIKIIKEIRLENKKPKEIVYDTEDKRIEALRKKAKLGLV